MAPINSHRCVLANHNILEHKPHLWSKVPVSIPQRRMTSGGFFWVKPLLHGDTTPRCYTINDDWEQMFYQPHSARVVPVVTAVGWACCVTTSHPQGGVKGKPFCLYMLISKIRSQTVKKVGCFFIWNFTTGAFWKQNQTFSDHKTDLKY